jgi:hypothetical protein
MMGDLLNRDAHVRKSLDEATERRAVGRLSRRVDARPQLTAADVIFYLASRLTDRPAPVGRRAASQWRGMRKTAKVSAFLPPREGWILGSLPPPRAMPNSAITGPFAEILF